MQYDGKYTIFDTSSINTYPLRTRNNKVKIDHLVFPEDINARAFHVHEETRHKIKTVAQAILSHRKSGKPVILFTGAHLIKNGLGPLIAGLIKQNMFTLVAGNGATAIHDFELALIGETSEHVPNALAKGQFGMAYEFAYINTALSLGNKYSLGYGESLGKMICDQTYRNEVLSLIARDDSPTCFAHPEASLLAVCCQRNIPFTVHAGIGVDVTDQHPSFDAQAKGGCSGRDFLIYTNEITKLTNGGVVLNIGSAVQGPEVLLKAVSMAANIGKAPSHIITADFDLRSYESEQTDDESSPDYYYRDQKSIVTRVPQAFAGSGLYVQGDQNQTVPLLYKELSSASLRLSAVPGTGRQLE